ncbi:MAG: sulfopyruvate decarboxylase subunit alpha [Candidatus Freyarchaeota archaeon]|nr:sulfopyruvate decarboxylase subunit alpha [Candidatus Jordarchaeia archaeon]
MVSSFAWAILSSLVRAGVDFAVSVPDTLFAEVLEKLGDVGIMHVPVTREEEGVGVAAGAYLGGRRPALLMQNSGLGNCLNALLSLNKTFGIPLLMLVSQRGGRGEKIVAQIPMGEATIPLLKAACIPFYIPGSLQQLEEHIVEAAERAWRDELPVAVIVRRELGEKDRSY